MHRGILAKDERQGLDGDRGFHNDRAVQQIFERRAYVTYGLESTSQRLPEAISTTR